MRDPKLTIKHPALEAQLKQGFNLFIEREDRRLTDAKPMRLTVKHRFYMFSLHIWEEAGGSHILDSKPSSEVTQLYAQRVFRRPNSTYYCAGPSTYYSTATEHPQTAQ
jgi:hypothetical protein